MEATGRQAGSADARAVSFERLIDRGTLDRSYRIAGLILGDPGEAEDVTHDAAVTAWRRFDELRDRDRFEAWFGRILVNACRDRLRARRRLPIQVDPADVTSLTDASAGDPSDALARRELIVRAVRSLSLEHREVVVLRYFADLTVDQIAERTGTASGTVKSRLHYALRRLRDGVADDGRSGR